MVSPGLWRPTTSAGECARRLENPRLDFRGLGDIEQEIPKQSPSCTVVSFWILVKRTFGLAPYKHGLDDLIDDHCLVRNWHGLTGDRAEWLSPHPPSDFACAKLASIKLVLTFQSSTLALVLPSRLGVLERCIWISHMRRGWIGLRGGGLVNSLNIPWNLLEFQSLKLCCCSLKPQSL